MSRKLRIEEEKIRQLKDDLQEEEDKLKLVQEKIFGPLVWRKYQNGLTIEDLKENRFAEAIEMILLYYTTEDILFRNTKIADDNISQTCFADRLLFKLRDRSSIILVDKDKDNCLAGVLILTPVSKSDFGRVYSRAMIVEGRAFRSIMDFMNYINRKVDVFEHFDCEIYLRYYLLCIRPEYRGKGFGYKLMQVGFDVARHLKIPVVTGVFNNYSLQKIAKKVGIDQILYEYQYTKWTDKNKELVFCDPGPGNYTCNIQAGLVPPPPEPEPAPVEEGVSQRKPTRADKKKAQAKADAKRKDSTYKESLIHIRKSKNDTRTSGINL